MNNGNIEIFFSAIDDLGSCEMQVRKSGEWHEARFSSIENGDIFRDKDGDTVFVALSRATSIGGGRFRIQLKETKIVRCSHRFKSGLQCRFDEGHDGHHDYSLKEWNKRVGGGDGSFLPSALSKEELSKIDPSKWEFRKGVSKRYGKKDSSD